MFQASEPWPGPWKKRQVLSAAMKKLGFKQPD
jgi:hypothetical protein